MDRLNEFQRTMLQWNRLHPYNAVHVIQVTESVPPAHFEECINHVLSEAGFGSVTIDHQRGTLCYHGGNPG